MLAESILHKSLSKMYSTPKICLKGGDRMKANRFLAANPGAAAETKAKHELMELVRENPELNLLAFQLREAGRSWHDLKTALEARIKMARRKRLPSTSESEPVC